MLRLSLRLLLHTLRSHPTGQRSHLPRAEQAPAQFTARQGRRHELPASATATPLPPLNCLHVSGQGEWLKTDGLAPRRSFPLFCNRTDGSYRGYYFLGHGLRTFGNCLWRYLFSISWSPIHILINTFTSIAISIWVTPRALPILLLHCARSEVTIEYAFLKHGLPHSLSPRL